MGYQLVKQIRDNDELRRSFDDLAKSVFEMSFEDWYKAGFWTNKYIPYCLVDDGKVVANASINIMDFSQNGHSKRYLQIGTVMTDPLYRHKGLGSRLLNEILNDWRDKVELIYLFANDSAVEFYPKFGFEKIQQYQASFVPKFESGDFRKLDLNVKSDQLLFKQHYQLNNQFSQFRLENNYNLVMFYCLDYLKDNIYYSEINNVVVIADTSGDILTIFDIFGRTKASMQQICNQLAESNIKLIKLGFTPLNTTKLITDMYEPGDETLFVYRAKDNNFESTNLIFPLLSHA